MFERFTDQSRRAVVLAQDEARRLNHNYIGTEHLLAGLRREEPGRGGEGTRVGGHHRGRRTGRDRDNSSARGDAAAVRAHPVHPAGQEVPGAFAAASSEA